jgi:hypothetical protein
MLDQIERDYYSREDTLRILQITLLEFGDLIAKGVLREKKENTRSFFHKGEVHTYLNHIADLDFVYEPQALSYFEQLRTSGVYSSVQTLALLQLNDFDLDFIVRSRLLFVFYRGLNWFFSKVQVDEKLKNITSFKEDMALIRRRSLGMTRPINPFEWGATLNLSLISTSLTPSQVLMNQDTKRMTQRIMMAAVRPSTELPNTSSSSDSDDALPETPPEIFDQALKIDEVLMLLDIEEHELDELIYQKQLKPYLKKEELAFNKFEVERYYHRLKAMRLVCAEEHMGELLEALEDGVYSFQEARQKLFLTEFQMELLTQVGALTVFRKGIHRYFNKARVDELEADPTTFAQLILKAKLKGYQDRSTLKKKNQRFSYVRHYRKREKILEAAPLLPPPQIGTPLTPENEDIIEEIQPISPEKLSKYFSNDEKIPLTLSPEAIVSLTPLSPESSEDLLDTSALLPHQVNSNSEEVDFKTLEARSQELTRIPPPLHGLLPQRKGKRFTYTDVRVALQMDAKEMQELVVRGKLQQIRKEKKVFFSIEQVLALRNQITSVELESFD